MSAARRQSRPSAVRQRICGVALLLTAGALAVGAAFVYGGPYDSAQGNVTSLGLQTRYISPPVLVVSYVYEVAGTTYNGVDTSGLVQHPDLAVGDAVAVRYSRSHPGVSALGEDPGWPAWLPLISAIAVTGVAVIATAQYAVNRPARDD